MAEPIPVVDFSNAFSPQRAARERVAHALARAGESAGFFYVRGHGIAEGLIEEQFVQARRFFALAPEEKAALHLSRSPCRRGYENVGDQTLDPGARPDLKESYYCGIDYPPSHPFVVAGYDSYGTSPWPATLPGFEAQMIAYIVAQQRLCAKIMQIVALALSLEEDYFDAAFVDPMVTLRLLRYPPQPQAAGEDVFGAGAHTDWGAVTTLAQDDRGGLEVLAADGTWVAAPPIANTFVVNFGDMVPRWTNGRFRSNLHRVFNRDASRRDRYSIPFFYSPRYTATIEAVPTCAGMPGEARLATCTAGEHIAAMVARTYRRAPATVATPAGACPPRR